MPPPTLTLVVPTDLDLRVTVEMDKGIYCPLLAVIDIDCSNINYTLGN